MSDWIYDSPAGAEQCEIRQGLTSIGWAADVSEAKAIIKAHADEIASLRSRAEKAEAALKRAGFAHNPGAEIPWKPPVNEDAFAPKFFAAEAEVERLRGERDEAREYMKKYQSAATVLCGAHIGQQFPYCPVCRAVELQDALAAAESRVEALEGAHKELFVLVRQMKNWMLDLQRYINGDPSLPRVFLPTPEDMAEQTKVLTHKARALLDKEKTDE